VAGGSPASAAGIVAGDLVVAVDGAVTAGWSVLRGVQTITGEPGSAVELRVRDAAGTERVITVERARIEEEEANPVDTGASVAP
jgi:carboxyl-terminal processing protease